MITSSVLYLPIGRRTFDMEAAKAVWKSSSEWLIQQCDTVYQPEAIVTSIEELQAFLDSVRGQRFDSVLYQSVTFADGEFASQVLAFTEAPFIVWSVREPSVGGRLRLNSLTGGNSTCNVLQNHRRPFAFVFGNPDETALQEQLLRQVQVQRLIGDLGQLSIGVIGDHPPGFFFSDANESMLRDQLGVRLHKLDLHQAFKESLQVEEDRWQAAITRAEEQVVGLNRSEQTVVRFAQFYTYVQDYIQANRIGAVAVRCWPDFFTELGAAACSTLSQLTEVGVMASCESDIHGAISMYILHQLSRGSAPYLGDLVHVNEESNSVVFWHCGAGAYSLAHSHTGARAGVHPNRKLGFTMDFGLKPGGVTIFRLGSTPDGYRLLIMKGEALDVPQPFHGTSVEVALSTPVLSTLNSLMIEGFEPHYAIVYDDVADTLVEFGRQLNIPTVIYV
ncbi:sulfoquinovose isomerase [Cohnella mopanensis]|uniref:sulfoquinovose isomerase n=1 Tax=Cohnella mopanensis TaxID=2911966 RepID=UPI001EF811B5|nr:hypothetical protein [Cohnella mopanensis]